MFRRTLLLLVPSLLWGDRGQNLYQTWHTNMKAWLSLANARTTNQAYSIQEHALWQVVRSDWKEFERYVNKYYKGEPNDTE